MAHSAKYGKNAVGHLFNHYGRSEDVERSAYVIRGNENIVAVNTVLNYNLACNDQPKSQLEFLHQRLSEVKVHNRKDVNVMVDWVVTAPKGLSLGDEDKFFRETYSFLNDRYGKENVISAYVHQDEITPHMHYAFVPVVEDKRNGGYKLSAKEAITLRDLKSFHGDLSRHLEKVFGRDIGVLNEATKEGNKSIAELKRDTATERIGEARREVEQILRSAKAERSLMLLEARQRVERAQGGIDDLEAQERALKRKIEGLQSELEGRQLKINEITAIRPQRTLTGAVKGITVEDVENLKQTAIVALKTSESVQSLSQECERLNRRCSGLEKQVPSITEKMSAAKEKSRLLEIEKAYLLIPDDVKRQYLPQKSKNIGRDMGRER